MGKSLVLGFFDGVHKAHKAVIQSAFEYSNDVTLITFKDTPAIYFGGKAEYILSRENSIKKIKELNVKEIVELDFSQIVKMKAKEYIEYLVKKYHPISISIGDNHTFGYNKEGNSVFLNQYKDLYHYQVKSVPVVLENNEVVSSTLIKNYLRKGDVEYANKLLESNFILEGTVIHGAKIGRTIGFPTANIKYPDNIVKLPFGVYGVKITNRPLTPAISNWEKEMTAVMNWGIKPTVNNTIEPVVEVHILDFNGDLYGKNIRIEILKQIRGEKKFESLEDLKAQIQEDINKCLKL